VTFDEIPPLYRHVWSVYSAFRRLGFTDDDVTYIAGPTVLPSSATSGTVSAQDYIHVVLTAQCRSFTVVTEPLDRPFPEAQAMLEKLRLAMRDRLVSDEDMDRIWRESKMGAVDYLAAFTFALLERGFVLPALAQRGTN
jgi:hypothetical protein